MSKPAVAHTITTEEGTEIISLKNFCINRVVEFQQLAEKQNIPQWAIPKRVLRSNQYIEKLHHMTKANAKAGI